MEYIKEAAYWLLAAVFGLVAWIFKSSQNTQDARLGTLEDRLVTLQTETSKQFREHNQEDLERHRQDRKEAREAIEALQERNDIAHDRIIDRLDNLIKNGKQ